MRFVRHDDMDRFEAQGKGLRVDVLRDLVDHLPGTQRHLVERTFFGGATLAQAASEVGIGEKTARLRINDALVTLAAGITEHANEIDGLLEGHRLGPVFAAFLDGEPGSALSVA